MLVTEVIDDAILLIRMQREEKRNAINADLTQLIDRALNRLDDDPSLRVGIITGTRTVFSAGTDMFDPRNKRTDRGGEYEVIRRFRSTPLIAAVEGPAVGGGFELALSCDMIVAACDATFGLPEPR